PGTSICACRLDTLSYVYLGYGITSDMYMLPGMDENDPAIVSFENTVTHMEFNFVTMITELTTLVEDAATVAEGAAEADKDRSFVNSLGETVNVYRLREGIERFFITDINNPAASARAQSELAVQFDIVGNDPSDYNHVPGGGNVLFMDGHVEFIKFPGEHPCNRAFAVVVGGQ
ncbi:MAG: hypothetical protein NTZ09_19060, partial [Candidatus Hydrogenedentes bacterium]|nr:hypothetical protein [Candidatus Hydrogenedentota bacterium]